MYHIVRWSYLGKYRTYTVYKDNEPFMIPALGKKISRRQAKAIVEMLNK